MKKSSQRSLILLFALTLLVLPAVSPAQVKVLMSGGFSAAYQELLPEFQNTSGITVTTARGRPREMDLIPSVLSFAEECQPM